MCKGPHVSSRARFRGAWMAAHDKLPPWADGPPAVAAAAAPTFVGTVSSVLPLSWPSLDLGLQKDRLTYEPATVAIGVLNIHFSGAPGLVNRSGVDSDAFRDEFRVTRRRCERFPHWCGLAGSLPRTPAWRGAAMEKALRSPSEEGLRSPRRWKSTHPGQGSRPGQYGL